MFSCPPRLENFWYAKDFIVGLTKNLSLLGHPIKKNFSLLSHSITSVMACTKGCEASSNCCNIWNMSSIFPSLKLLLSSKHQARKKVCCAISLIENGILYETLHNSLMSFQVHTAYTMTSGWFSFPDLHTIICSNHLSTKCIFFVIDSPQPLNNDYHYGFWIS